MENNSDISISFIGAGNVAHHLANSFFKEGIRIQQVYNRSQQKGKKLCKMVHAEYIRSLKELEPSDVLIIAVNDDAITTVSSAIPKNVSRRTIIVHTSGSQPISLLKEHAHYGGFYPLQSFRKEQKVDITKVPILISAIEQQIEIQLLLLGKKISENVSPISDSDRSLLHLPAVMVNNFTNHLLQLAYEYCEKTNLDFSLLHPLIHETVDRLNTPIPPKEMQTGPAIRKDMVTIKRHINQLEGYPEVSKLYKFMSQHIEDYYK